MRLAFSVPLLAPYRGHGLQLFHRAHEENESELSTWRSDGHSLCQHALANPGDAAPVKPRQTVFADLLMTHFSHTRNLNMYRLLQILDSEIFELMHQNGDYTHFYFCYRWFLLDFKRGKLMAECNRVCTN